MPSPRRILYVCHDGQLYGSQQSLRLIVKHLPRADYEPHVSIARSGPLNDVLKSLPNVTLHAHRRLQWVKHDSRSLPKRMGDVVTLVASLFPKSLALAALIRRERVQLVHTNSLVSLEGAVAARLAGVPHVWHIRELFMEENPKLHMVLGRNATRWLIHRLSDRVVCISGAVRAQFSPWLEACPEKFPVIHNALSLESFPDLETKPAKPASNVFRVGYIGRLSAGKRFQDLLEAVALLRDDGCPLELLVAGQFVDTPYEEAIQNRVMELNLAEVVRFLGFQPDLTSLYPTLDVLALPSLNEPFGRVVIEAMAAGVPCVAADSGGVPEIMALGGPWGETGLLYPPKNVEALAQTLKIAHLETERMMSIRENAGRMVRERFTIMEQVKSLLGCYRNLLRQED